MRVYIKPLHDILNNKDFTFEGGKIPNIKYKNTWSGMSPKICDKILYVYPVRYSEKHIKIMSSECHNIIEGTYIILED